LVATATNKHIEYGFIRTNEAQDQWKPGKKGLTAACSRELLPDVLESFDGTKIELQWANENCMQPDF